MERAYAQARHWPADRAWRRAYLQVSEGRVSSGMGMYLCLLDYYARRDGIRELFETCEWILTRMEDLNAADKLSMCRIVCHIVKSLKDDEFDVHEARLKLILRLPLAVILDAVAEQRLSCALTGLLEFSRVFEESVTLKQCSDFEGDFLGVALAIDRAIRAGHVRDKVKASETKTREEYDRERTEAIDMADAIKKKLQEPPYKTFSFNDEASRRERLGKEWQQRQAEQWSNAMQGSGSSPPPEPYVPPDPSVPQLPPPLAHPVQSSEKKPMWGMSAEPDKPAELMPAGHSDLSGATKLQKAENELVEAYRAFGAKSTQVAQYLAHLIEVKAEHFPAMKIDAEVEQLKEIVADESVEISPYLLRKILSTIGNTDERQHLLSILAFIEQSILSRREESVGLDISLGIALWRLISLWRETDSLVEGRAYCDLLLQRLAGTRGLDDPIVRQVSSAIVFMARFRTGERNLRRGSDALSLKAIDESAEFAAMLTTLALDDLHVGRTDSAELILNELLWFYSDTVGDVSRKVGEMLWLTQETTLNRVRACTLALVRQSEKMAADTYLNARLGAHAKRLLERIEDIEFGNEILAALIIARRDENAYESYQDRMDQVKEILSLRNYVRRFEEEAGIEWKVAIDSAQEKAKAQPKSKSEGILLKLKSLAENKEWTNFAAVWKKGAQLIDGGDCVYRLGQMGLLAARDGKFDICENIIALLNQHVSPSCVHVFNCLSEICAKRFLELKDYKRAADLIERALSNKHQLGDFCNCLRLQLAEIYVSTGNLFEATALIYEAYSNIPDSETGSAKQLIVS